jgi:hypothetical protein
LHKSADGARFIPRVCVKFGVLKLVTATALAKGSMTDGTAPVIVWHEISPSAAGFL